MHIKTGQFRPVLLLSFGLALSMATTFAADKPKTAAAESPNSYDVPQPDHETLDLNMYQRIREECLYHSHIMEYASALTDGIGPRLTGSPNMAKANAWTRDQFTAMGCSNAHLESWGEFGMGWQQLNAWVRMTAPDTAVFIAQAVPWSPGTTGPVSDHLADVKSETWRNKEAGGQDRAAPASEVGSMEQPLRRHDERASGYTGIPAGAIRMRTLMFVKEYLDKIVMRGKVGKLAAEEHALAILFRPRWRKAWQLGEPSSSIAAGA
jgi:hypothetical protein